MTQQARLNLATELCFELRSLGSDDKELKRARQIAISLNCLLYDALEHAETAEEAFEWHEQIINATKPVININFAKKKKGGYLTK